MDAKNDKDIGLGLADNLVYHLDRNRSNSSRQKLSLKVGKAMGEVWKPAADSDSNCGNHMVEKQEP